MDMTLWDAEQQQQGGGDQHMALGSLGPQSMSRRKTHPVWMVVVHSRRSVVAGGVSPVLF